MLAHQPTLRLRCSRAIASVRLLLFPWHKGGTAHATHMECLLRGAHPQMYRCMGTGALRQHHSATFQAYRPSCCCRSLTCCSFPAAQERCAPHVVAAVAAGGPNFYSISATTAAGNHTAVRRRFNDLVALHETLKATFRGCVIPFRPGKTVANSTNIRQHREPFLRDRAYAIKCYLAKVAHHPEIKESTVRPSKPCAGAVSCGRPWQHCWNVVQGASRVAHIVLAEHWQTAPSCDAATAIGDHR